MSLFPELRQRGAKELPGLFLGDRALEMPEEERELWLQEVAILIAKSSAKGVDFLLSCVPVVDESRLRAILLAMSFAQKLSVRKRAAICELARTLLHDERPLVVAEAVDTLRRFSSQVEAEFISPLLHHSSPYVVGSALRFFASHDPERAIPLLEEALKSKEPIVRQNAVDELDDMNYAPALSKIRRLLRDPDEDVRQAAHYAVTHLEDASI